MIVSDTARGRSFRATCLAYVRADKFWQEGRGDALRPIWAMFAGSDAEVRAFAANIRAGRRAVFASERGRSMSSAPPVELLRSAGYEFSWQRELEGSIFTAHVPRFFRIDPGLVDPEGVSFVLLSEAAWLRRQGVDCAGPMGHARRLGYEVDEDGFETIAPAAHLFAAMLDRRTRCPILSDPRFFVQLLLACLRHKLATLSRRSEYGGEGFGVNHELGLESHGLEEVGLARAVAFRASHSDVEAMLAQETKVFFDKVPRWRASR